MVMETLVVTCDNDLYDKNTTSDETDTNPSELDTSTESEYDKDSDLGPPLLVSDGLIGKLKCVGMSSLMIDGKCAKELFDSTESLLSKSHFGFKRVMFSGGHFDITASGYGLDQGVIRHSQAIQRDMVERVMCQIEAFHDKVSKAGGCLVVTALIPCPSQVVKEDSCLTKFLRCIISNVYVELNKQIRQFNLSNGYRTPNINSIVEEKNQKNSHGDLRLNRMLYDFNPNQRKIKRHLFEDDKMHLKPKTQRKMLEVVRSHMIRADCRLTSILSKR